MSLHTSSPRNYSELEKILNDEEGFLVIMEITGCDVWEEIVSKISLKFRTVKFCIISDSGESAADAVNLMLDICGYINTSMEDSDVKFESILVRIYERIATVCGGLMAFDSSGKLKVIKYTDIYYIETIKQQHRCTVYHRYGNDVIRADISKLINRLDSRFEITRSSTIANLSMAIKLSDRMVYFEDGSCCNVTEKRMGTVKKIMLSTAVI